MSDLPQSAGLCCPGCGESMVEVDSDGVQIDVCSACNGLWLDKGELERLGGKLPSHQGTGQSAGQRFCPRCRVPMDERDAHLAKVDICWGCGGIFVASSGFDALVQAAGGRAPAPDDDATPLSGIPVFVPGAARTDAAKAPSAPPPPPEAPAPQAAAVVARAKRSVPRPDPPRGFFWCELCRTPNPVEREVIGERISVCPDCARRHEIRHDPDGRKRVEAERESDNRFRPGGEPGSILLHILQLLPFL